MNHIDEGTLLALLDGELSEEEGSRVEAHVEACEACATSLAELREASDRLEAALALLDRPAPAEVSAWTVRQRAAARRMAFPRRALLRAAAMVLGFAAVGSAAIPNSPVRTWVAAAWRHGVSALSGGEDPAPAVATAAGDVTPETASAPTPEAGLVVQPERRRVVVSIESPAPDLVARVRVVSDARVAVRARGEAASARFRTAPGRLDVVSPGSGELVIEVPASQIDVTLEVNGRVLVSKRGPELTVAGARVEVRPGEEIVVDLTGSGSVN